MTVNQKKFANYSKKLKVLRNMEENYDNRIGSVILFDTIDESNTACKNRNEWNPCDWVTVPVTLSFTIPD